MTDGTIGDFRPTNHNRVPARAWTRWNLVGKHTFNKLFDHMINNQRLYSHPSAVEVPMEHWKTTCWNAAFMGADIANRGCHALLKDPRPRRGR